MEWAWTETECLMPPGGVDQYLDIPEANSYFSDYLTNLLIVPDIGDDRMCSYTRVSHAIGRNPNRILTDIH
jgi:hypothetical protein